MRIEGDFWRDGAVCVRGAFDPDEVALARRAIDENLADLSDLAKRASAEDDGAFVEDFCNWQRLSSMEEFIRTSSAARLAGELMGARAVRLYHDHVLVKEPGTKQRTPWHTDGPYYFVEGKQTVSFWVPLDPVKEASLRCVAGSHLWEKDVLPTRWMAETNFYPGDHDYIPVPDPDAEGMRVMEWEMEPGDAVAFHYRTLHGTRGNTTTARRRAFSLRLVGDDARYVERPGPTSPPFPGHGMVVGQRLREDRVPVLTKG